MHAIDSEGELRTDDRGAPSALLTWIYAKDKGGGDYHDAMNGERLKEWVEGCFIPAYKHLHPDWATTDPAVLVLDNAPYHCFGMTNPFSQTKAEILEVMRSMGLRDWTQRRSERDGGDVNFTVPVEGDFERAPRGRAHLRLHLLRTGL